MQSDTRPDSRPDLSQGLTPYQLTPYQQLVDTIVDFTAAVGIYLPDDVEARLGELSAQETDPAARTMYRCIEDDLALAKQLHRPLCQDTGVLQYFVEVGTRFPYIDDIGRAIEEAAARATLETPLRPNVVRPLGEHNTGNNVGYGAPYVEYELVPGGEDLRLRLYMAGGGCSLPGRSKVLMPLEGVEGIKKFIYETVVDWGVNACPPLCIGVGLGTCAATSAMLSKKALLRPIGTHNPYPEVAALEDELRTGLDSLGIAPLGFGGSRTVLSVNIECAGHHPATLGVGITTGCWATRRGDIIIHPDLSTEFISHSQHQLGKHDDCNHKVRPSAESDVRPSAESEVRPSAEKSGKKIVLTTPLTYEQLKDLRIGDTVYLTGELATCRDSGHRRAVKDGILPERYSFKDGAIFHAGPIVGRDADGKQYMVSIGPTTSRRMEALEADFIEQTGVRLVIGKGGMMDKTAEACRKFGAIHCAFPGGCAVVAAQEVEEITDAEWLDFGMPEALWVMRVKEFGPLVVSIDTEGNNLFEDNKKVYKERLALLL
jgi:tartrate/fumarate subfamily iron-sulfur-dependent hydro-lyase alpha chain/tartrate/fumarate subfamily iron-sulfur-dependent hydro-lyase beta chain